MILSQAVLLPLLGLFVWGYLALRPASSRRTVLAFYDAAVIATAGLLSVGAAWFFNDLYANPGSAIWPVVMSTAATFHVFPAVLLIGGYIRRRIFGSAPS